MYITLNMNEKYDCLAKRVDEHFKTITNDSDVTFMLSGTSAICLTSRGVWWIKGHCNKHIHLALQVIKKDGWKYI